MFAALLVACVLMAASCASQTSASLTCDQQSEKGTLLQLTTENFLTRSSQTDYDHPSWLSDCKRIYLDVGSNIGVQVRKLFEPRLYPKAPVLPLFDTHFGTPAERCAPAHVSGICALGIEANPYHQKRLRELEDAYTAKGWHVHFYPFAAAYTEGVLSFMTDPEGGKKHEWGAHLAAIQKMNVTAWQETNVTAIDFGAFLTSLPRRTVRLMKMDIEGAEWDALASMEKHGAMCAEHVESAFIETHETGKWDRPKPRHWHDKETLAAIRSRLGRQSCVDEEVLSITEIDDESFADDHGGKYAFGDFSACRAGPLNNVD